MLIENTFEIFDMYLSEIIVGKFHSPYFAIHIYVSSVSPVLLSKNRLSSFS